MAVAVAAAAGAAAAPACCCCCCCCCSAAAAAAAAFCCCCCCCACCCADIAIAESSVSAAALTWRSSPSGCSPTVRAAQMWPRFGSPHRRQRYPAAGPRFLRITCARSIRFHRLRTPLSVRPGRCDAIFDQRLPCCSTSCRMRRSSSTVHIGTSFFESFLPSSPSPSPSASAPSASASALAPALSAPPWRPRGGSGARARRRHRSHRPRPPPPRRPAQRRHDGRGGAGDICFFSAGEAGRRLHRRGHA